MGGAVPASPPVVSQIEGSSILTTRHGHPLDSYSKKIEKRKITNKLWTLFYVSAVA
jgi:hypothetical protein